MPHVVVVAQHARHDAGRGEEVQAQRGADVVVELLVVQRCGAEIRVCELGVLFANEHHDADGVVVERCADCLGPGPHFDGVAHVAFVELVAHPPLGAVHGGLFFGVHLVVFGWRAGAHVGVHGFATGVAASAEFADYPVAPVTGLGCVGCIT